MADDEKATRELFERVGGMSSSAVILSTIVEELAKGNFNGASAGAWSQRYLKECLSSLAAAGIIQFKPSGSSTESGKFILPAAHIPILADETSPMFSAGWFGMIRLLFNVADKVSDCFLKPSADASESGVPFTMGRAHGPGFVKVLVEKQLRAVPGFIERLERPQGATVADIGCGSGNVLLYLAKRFPNSKFYGYDIDVKSIEAANEKLAKEPSIKNLKLKLRRLKMPTSLPHVSGSGGPFDVLLTVDVIHDIPHPKLALKRISEALKDDGIYIMLEPKASSHLENNIGPRGAFLYGSLANGGEG
ncbi:S-adenosyl-L-methionine-dependent methyltransferase [Chytridium lagenaria]|nr:S-adenosyl-L-methionine-dependent methyltransferase [Chytridium lagenaria]